MIDVLLLVENSTYWPVVPTNDNIHVASYGWWKQQITVAYNKCTCKKEYQHGGCTILSNELMIGRHCSSGSDPMKLGSWTWTLYKGKNNIVIQCIEGIKPWNNNCIYSAKTVSKSKRYGGQSNATTTRWYYI